MPTEFMSAQDAMDQYWASAESRPETMWDSWKDPQRGYLLSALACVPEFKSLYELGCGSGPNLRAIAATRPKVQLGGCDVNSKLTEWATDHLGVPIDTAGFPISVGAEWDVTCSCYALTYIPAETVQETFRLIDSKYLVLVEPTAYVAPFGRAGVYGQRASAADPSLMCVPFYAHPYPELLRNTGWTLTWRWPIYPHYQGLNAVTVAERL